MSTRTSSVKLIGRWLAALLLGIGFTAGVAYLGLRYYVWPRLDQWRPQIVDRLSLELGRPIAIDRIETSLHGWRPELTLHGFALRDADGRTALQARSASVVLALSRLLADEPTIDAVTLTAPSLTVEYFGARQWRIAGVDLAAGDASPADGTAALRAVLGVPRLDIDEGRVELIDRVDDSRLTAAGLRVAIRNDGRQHRFAIDLSSADGGTDELRVVAVLDSPAADEFADWRQWRADAFVGARALQGTTLSALARLVAGHRLEVGAAQGSRLDEPSGGGEPTLDVDNADLMAWGRWREGRADDVLVKLDARRPRWRFDAPDLAGQLDRVRTQWRAAAVDPDVYRIDVDRLQLLLPGGAELVSGDGTQLRLSPAGVPRGGRLAIQPFDLGAVRAWAGGQRWPAVLAERLGGWLASGRVETFALDWRDETGDGPRWRAEAGFDRVSLAPARPIERRAADGHPLPSTPSVDKASGRLVADDAGGRLSIGGDQGSAWSFPGLFAQPRVVLDQWSAQLAWTRAERGELQIDVQDLRFANADAEGRVSGTLRFDGERHRVDLTGRLVRARATSVARYLPLSIPPSVRDWIAQAVAAGDSDDVRLTLAGDLHDFPYDKPGASGQFRVDARLRGGQLRFAPDWPSLDQIGGRLTFERAGMTATIDGAMLGGVPVRDTRLAIADFHHGVLGIDGQTRAPADRLLDLVNASPLERFVNGALREASATGDVDLKLSARLPLHHDASDAHDEFDAVLTLHDNEFVLGPGKPALTALRGTLRIGHDGVIAREVSARLLGGPLHVDASAPSHGHVVLKARGGLSFDGLRTLSDNPLTRKLDGHADYEADIDIDSRGVKLRLSSDLVGVVSELPAPFAKRAGVAMPLRVVSTPAAAAADGFVTSIALGDAVRMQIARRFDAKAGRALIDRAAFAMNTEPALPETGLSVALNLPRVDFDAWGAAMASAAIGQPGENLGGEFAPGFSLLPTHVSVLAGELLVGGKQLHEVVFGATRQQGYWQANVHAREVDGYFSWRDAPPGQPLGKLTARFARLEIPPSRRQEIESFMETDRTDLPELDVTAEQLVLNNHPLGRLKLLAGNGSEAGRPAWRLQQLRIEHPAATLDASGVWSQRSRRGGDPAARTTALDFKLDLRDAGALLNDFGIRDAIRGAPGSIEGRVDWAGSPLAIDYPSLHGQLGIALGKGQFLKTDPGLAKLIGVLNLQSLPRRLSLDFRDIFAEGFAFDDIHGDVRIDRGVAHADDMRMNGVQARVHLSGDADLARETQSLDVEVRPHLNAGLASLAYAAVNPVIGFGSFLAQFVLRKPLEEAFTYQYRITGPWADPVVVEKSRSRAPDQPPEP